MKKLLLGLVASISVAQINASNAALPSNMTVPQYIQLLTKNAQQQYNTALNQFNQSTAQVCASQEPIFVSLCANMKKQVSSAVSDAQVNNGNFSFYLSQAAFFESYIAGANDVIKFVQSQPTKACPACPECPA